MKRRTLAFMFAMNSVVYTQAQSQSNQEVKSWEWTQVVGVSVARDTGYPSVQGFLKNESGLQDVHFAIGEFSSNLRQLCYDAIMKTLDNNAKYQLTMKAYVSEPNRVVSCQLSLKAP